MAPAGARWRSVADMMDRGRDKNGLLKSRCNLLYGCDASALFDVGKAYLDGWNKQTISCGCILVCDELDMLPPVLRRSRDSAYSCLHYGRPAGIHIVATARAPQNVDKGWILNATDWRLFRISESRALEQIKKSGLRGIVQVCETLPLLKNYGYYSVKSV